MLQATNVQQDGDSICVAANPGSTEEKIKVTTYHVSCSSDPVTSYNNYVGIVLYSRNGQVDWHTNGVHCKTGYIYITNSDGLVEQFPNEPGKVHGAAYLKLFGESMTCSDIVGSGFSIQRGEFKFISGAFNASHDAYHDNEREMKRLEAEWIEYVVQSWSESGCQCQDFRVEALSEWVYGPPAKKARRAVLQQTYESYKVPLDKKVVIRKVGQFADEYLYATAEGDGNGRRYVHTWVEGKDGASAMTDQQAHWLIQEVGSNKFVIMHVGQDFFGEYLYVKNTKVGTTRNVYTWMDTRPGLAEKDPQAHWLIEPLEDKMLIRHAGDEFKGEYLYAGHGKYDPERRNVHMWKEGVDSALATTDRQAHWMITPVL